MKRLKVSLLLAAVLLLVSSIPFQAQTLIVHDMIGQKLSKVISKFGKPAHQDKGNPAMKCIFYKTKTYQMVFVANEEGVFQIEGWKTFRKKSSAQKEMQKLLLKCRKTGFRTDTLNVSEYDLRKDIIDLNVSLFENAHSKKYEVKIKATRNEM